MPQPNVPAVSREALLPLIHASPVRFSALELRQVLLLLTEPGPRSARWLARELGESYASIKRVVRGREAWRVVVRSPQGLHLRVWAPMRGADEAAATAGRAAPLIRVGATRPL